jgi:hypothetical protein
MGAISGNSEDRGARTGLIILPEAEVNRVTLAQGALWTITVALQPRIELA